MVEAICEDCRAGAGDVRRSGVDASHFLAEDQPDDVADQLRELVDRAPWS